MQWNGTSYRWQENTDTPDLGYKLFLFKPATAFLLKVRVLKCHINPDDFYENIIPDEIAAVRNLPFPQWMPRRDLAPHAARADVVPAPGVRCRDR